MQNKQKIFVLGGAGYVGVKLCEKLLAGGFRVTCFDTCWFGTESLQNCLSNPNFKLIHGDLRNIELLKKSLDDHDSFIHLACISNDPSFDLDPSLGKSINFDYFSQILELTNNSSINRFIYASSSSVYGVKEEDKVTENLKLEPLTDYSHYKAQCEKILLNFDSNFCKSILRPATVCGSSPRLRLDLVVNILTFQAFYKRKIRIMGGNQYRPNIHIEDMCDAYSCLINAQPNLINNQIFNVGGTNYTVLQLAKIVKDTLGDDIELIQEESNDLRSYKIDSSKIYRMLNFKPRLDVKDAVLDLAKIFTQMNYNQLINDVNYFNIKKINQLISVGEIN